jgi:hypothetical protein
MTFNFKDNQKLKKDMSKGVHECKKAREGNQDDLCLNITKAS